MTAVRDILRQIASGELDAAAAALKQMPIDRKMRDAQSQLANALLTRGRSRLLEDLTDLAWQDCERAASLAGVSGAVQQLRLEIASIFQAKRDRHEREQRAIASAQQQAAHGFFSRARSALADAGSERGRIESELSARELELTQRVTRIRERLDQDDLENAARELTSAQSLGVSDLALGELAREIASEITTRSEAAFAAGRLDETQRLLSLISPASHVPLQLLSGAIEQARQAATLLECGDWQSALPIVGRLATRWPQAKWLEEARQTLANMNDAMESILASPLGQLLGEPATAAVVMPPPITSPPPLASASLPGSFVLSLEGIGAFLVCVSPRVRIGPATASPTPEIALQADPSLASATITHSDDDWIFESVAAMQLNGKPQHKAILSDGSRLLLSSRCLLKIKKPHPASGTLLLELSGSRLLRGDLRQIVLLDRELIIGQGAAHVVVPAITPPLILQRSGSGLIARQGETRVALAMGVSWTLGNLRGHLSRV